MIDWLYAGLAGTSHMSLATVADAAAAAVPSATVPPGLSDPIHVCAATAAAAAVSAGAVAVLTYVLSDTTHVRAVTIAAAAAAAAAAAVASAAASVIDPPYSHHRPAPPTPLTCVGQDLLCLSVAILVQIITGTRFTPFDRIDTDHHAVVGD